MEIDEDFVKKGFKRMSQEDVKRAAKKGKRAVHKADRTVLKKMVDRIHDFAGMLDDYVDGEFRDIPWWSISAIAGCVLYIVNPLDVVPDVIPILGLLDDLCVATLTLALVEQDILHWKEWKKSKAKAKPPPSTTGDKQKGAGKTPTEDKATE